MPNGSTNDEPILNLDNIQGNVIPGFKKDHQHFLFYRIVDVDAARRWLVSLHPRISTAAEVFQAHTLWKTMRSRLGREPDTVQFIFLNVAISASGLRKLTSPAEVEQFADGAFKIGMKERSELLGDPADEREEGHVSKWLVGGTEKSVDLVLILASDDRDWLLEVEDGLEREAAQHGLEFVHRDRGRVREGELAGHEHFGFKDGVSEPAVRGRQPVAPHDYVYPRTLPLDPAFAELRADFAAPGKVLVWPGHFLFGYGRQVRDNPRELNSEDKPKGPSWADDGSYVVYRRLRQHVDRFATFVAETAQRLREKYTNLQMNDDRLGAMLVGRWKSGTPLMRSPFTDEGIEGEAVNYFLFSTDVTLPIPGDQAPLSKGDPNGAVCPLAAHIRKINPRDEATDLGPRERTIPKLMLRRGITYDKRVEGDPEPSDDRGLLFVAYQSSISNQFEFVMRDWVNRAERPRDDAGHDPILAQGGERFFNLILGDKLEKIPIPGSWVVPTGGEYFFAPSIHFFQERLAQLG